MEEEEGRIARVRMMSHEKNLASHCWLWRCKEDISQGNERTLEAGEARETDSSLEPLQGAQAC